MYVESMRALGHLSEEFFFAVIIGSCVLFHVFRFVDTSFRIGKCAQSVFDGWLPRVKNKTVSLYCGPFWRKGRFFGCLRSRTVVLRTQEETLGSELAG